MLGLSAVFKTIKHGKLLEKLASLGVGLLVVAHLFDWLILESCSVVGLLFSTMAFMQWCSMGFYLVLLPV